MSVQQIASQKIAIPANDQKFRFQPASGTVRVQTIMRQNYTVSIQDLASPSCGRTSQTLVQIEDTSICAFEARPKYGCQASTFSGPERDQASPSPSQMVVFSP